MAALAAQRSARTLRDKIQIPVNEYIWKPAIIRMTRGGILELDITNEDHNHHMILMPHRASGKYWTCPRGPAA